MTKQVDVLIVDDDTDLAETMRDIFEMHGYAVRMASDGQAGLAALHQRLPDVLVLDVEMPVLDGPDMAYHMLLHNAGYEGVPIVLISGHPDLPRFAARVGTPYSVPKPSGLVRLLEVVERALRERVPPAPRPAQEP